MTTSRTEKASPLFELARMVVRFDHLASLVVNSNHCMMERLKNGNGARATRRKQALKKSNGPAAVRELL